MNLITIEWPSNTDPKKKYHLTFDADLSILQRFISCDCPARRPNACRHAIDAKAAMIAAGEKKCGPDAIRRLQERFVWKEDQIEIVSQTKRRVNV